MSTFRATLQSMLVTIAAVLTCLLGGSAGSVLAQEKERTKLPGGTVIALRLVQTVDSEMSEGTPIELRVLRDVMVDGKAVVRSGWPASGTVTSVKSSSSLGRAGRISMKLISVRAVDGQEILIRGSLDKEGDDKATQTVLLGLLCIPLLLLEGDDAMIPAGTEVRAYVEQDYMIDAKGARLGPGVN